MHTHKSHTPSQLLMASSILLASHILPIILFHLLLAIQPTSSDRFSTPSFRAPLTRVHSGKTMPKYTSTNLDPSASLIQSPMIPFKDVYTMNLAIGTPPVLIKAMIDTGSDLIWTKCKGSGGLFDSSKSTSFSKDTKSCLYYGLGYDCKQHYADGNSVSVTFGKETLKVGDSNIKNVTFACGKPVQNIPYNGIVGMGRGEWSLVSQLKERVFLYCLGSRFAHETSSVLLTGSKARNKNTNTQTTPLLKIEDKSYYYISLEGISIGKTRLPVTKSDFAVSSYGDGGMIIDSGSTFTYLEQRIVDMISNEFINQTKLVKYGGYMQYKELKHCFKPLGNVYVPNLVFHFEGADWVLQRENYIYEKKGKNVACLAFIANDKDEGSDRSSVSIFGNMNQQNMMVVYDLDKNSLSFKRANCNML